MNHNDIVRQSFKKQAEKFAAYHMSKVEYTDYLIQKIAATGEEHALEVAAGTCICGRALAPYVKDITCLDMTEEMLAQGIRLAEESHIETIPLTTNPYTITFDQHLIEIKEIGSINDILTINWHTFQSANKLNTFSSSTHITNLNH